MNQNDEKSERASYTSGPSFKRGLMLNQPGHHLLIRFLVGTVALCAVGWMICFFVGSTVMFIIKHWK